MFVSFLGIVSPERSIAEPVSGEVNAGLIQMVAEKIGSQKLISERAMQQKLQQNLQQNLQQKMQLDNSDIQQQPLLVQ